MNSQVLPGEPYELRRLDRGLIAGITVVGAIAPLRHYLSGRSLWNDEAALALNIIDADLVGLLGPLDHNQVAPFGFLILTKLAVTAFGSLDERVFRLFSLLAALSIGPLTYRAALILRGRVTAVCASLLTVLAPSVIYYSAEFKPYSIDIFATAMLLWVTARIFQQPSRRRPTVEFACASSVLATVSFPATLVGASCVAVLTIWSLQHGIRRVLFSLSAAVPLAAMSMVTLLIAQPSPDTATYMDAFWTGGLLTFPPGGPWELSAALHAIIGAFNDALAHRASLLVVPVGMLALGLWIPAVLGYAVRIEVALLLVMPWVAAVSASRLGLYPLSDRLAVYLLPTITLGVGSTIAALSSERLRSPRILVGVGLVTALLLNAALVLKDSIEREEYRPVLETVIANLGPGDRVYVNRGARYGFEFYWRQLAVSKDVEVVLGRYQGGSMSDQVEEIEATAGGRPTLWVVYQSRQLTGGPAAIERALLPRWNIERSVRRQDTAAFLIRPR